MTLEADLVLVERSANRLCFVFAKCEARNHFQVRLKAPSLSVRRRSHPRIYVSNLDEAVK
jgi:hypothetical protein